MMRPGWCGDGASRWAVLSTGSVLAIVLFLGVFLRVWGLSAEQPWWDEYLALRSLNEPSSFAYCQASRAYLPATCTSFLLLQYGMGRIGLKEPLYFRLVSVFFGMVSLVMLGLVGARVLGGYGGLCAAALGAVNFELVYYSQEIREYSLVILLTLLSSYCYLSWLKEGERRLVAVVWVCTNSCLLFTHLMAIFFIVPQLLHLMVYAWRQRTYKEAVSVIGLHMPAVFIWCMSWMMVDMARLTETSPWICDLQHGAMNFLSHALELAGGRCATAHYGLFRFPWSLLINGAIAAGVIGGIIIALHECLGRRVASAPTLSYLVVWAVLPPALLYAVSWFAKPCFMPRYVVGSTPAFILLIVLALTRVRWNGVRGILSVLVFAALLLVSLAHPVPLRGNFAEAAEFIAQISESHGTVFAATPTFAMMMSYYRNPLYDPDIVKSHPREGIRFVAGTPSQAPGVFIDNETPAKHEANGKAFKATGHPYRTYTFNRSVRLRALMDTSRVLTLTVYVRGDS